VDEVGTINGRPIELIFADDSSNASQAVDMAKKLVERDKIVLALGPGMPSSVDAVAPYYKKKKIPMIPLWPKPKEILKKDNWVYFPMGTNPMFGYASGLFAAEDLKAKTAVIAALDQAGSRDYVKGFTQGFEQRGGKVIQSQWFPADVVDFSTYITNMQEADLAAVIVWGTLDVPFFKQYRELVKPGKRPVLWLWDEFDMEVNRQLLNGPAEIPTYSASSVAYKDAQTEKDMKDRYLKRYSSGLPANAPFHVGYFIASIGLQALKMTGGKGGEPLREAFEKMDWESIRGRVKFTNRMMDTIVGLQKVDAGTTHYKTQPLKQYRIRGEWNADKSDMVIRQAP
jgi:branched-chain amino acid transport system substrate-binding protein